MNENLQFFHLSTHSYHILAFYPTGFNFRISQPSSSHVADSSKREFSIERRKNESTIFHALLSISWIVPLLATHSQATIFLWIKSFTHSLLIFPGCLLKMGKRRTCWDGVEVIDLFADWKFWLARHCSIFDGNPWKLFTKFNPNPITAVGLRKSKLNPMTEKNVSAILIKFSPFHTNFPSIF